MILKIRMHVILQLILTMNNLNTKEVLNISQILKKEFLICENCNLPSKGMILNLSSCDAWQFCSICNRYDHFPGYTIVKAKVKLIEREDCDCIEKYGHINHCDGGNYHVDVYQVIEIIEVY